MKGQLTVNNRWDIIDSQRWAVVDLLVGATLVAHHCLPTTYQPCQLWPNVSPKCKSTMAQRWLPTMAQR